MINLKKSSKEKGKKKERNEETLTYDVDLRKQMGSRRRREKMSGKQQENLEKTDAGEKHRRRRKEEQVPNKFSFFKTS